MALDEGRPIPPPVDLPTRNLHLTGFELKDWRRIFGATLGPCYYSESVKNRFSSPGFGLLYIGDKVVTAFWETFWDDLGTMPEADRQISEKKINARNLCRAQGRRLFRVFDATNAKALKAVSASTATFAGDYANCQAWAIALFKHPQEPEGILYPSARHKDGVCLVLFAGRTDCTEVNFTDIEGLSTAPAVRSLLTKERIGLL